MAKIALVVTGGVAAYKSAALTSALAKQGHDIQVVMTASALEFVGAATFAALSNRPVATKAFDSAFPLGPHIEIARWADLLVVAPATASWLAKAASGLADDLASTLYLAYSGTTLVAPAMNAEMWSHPAVRRNVEQLTHDGIQWVGPDEGWQACRTSGEGRMSEPEVIAKAIESQLAQD